MAGKKSLNSFRPQQLNANRHNQRGMGLLEGSMREVGYTAPMIAAKDGEVISGSARLEASADVFGVDAEPIIVESDGKRPIVVIRTDIPNANTKMAKRIGLLENRVQEVNLEFDPSILAQMEAEEAGILAGLWNENELEELLKEGDIGENGVTDVEPEIDRAEELRVKWGVELGQLWQIGEHRLICGDCTDIAVVERVMGNSKVDCLFFDPEWDAMPVPPQYNSALVFTDGRRAGDSIRLFGSPTWVFDWDCVSCWYTPNRPLQRAKYCFWYGELERFKFDGSHYGDAGEMRTVWNSRGKYTFNPDPRGKHLADVYNDPITKLHADSEHSHSKPLDWVRMLIADCTDGDVYDPFCGSGTTLIACEQLNRRCRAIEISPAYVAVAIERWHVATGKEPQLIS